MSIKDLTQALTIAGVQYKIVLAASSVSEELYWLELLAKKLRGYLMYRGKQKQQFKAPVKFSIGGATRDAIVFPLQDVLGRTRNHEDALVRLGIMDHKGRQLSSNRAVSVLTWLLQTRIVLLEQEASGGITLVDNGIRKTPSKMFFSSTLNCIGIPCLHNMHVELAYMPSQQTFVHELEHARDFYITGFRDSIGITNDEVDDFTQGGQAYYFDLTEVKARCKELAMIIKEVLAEKYARLVDATELAHVDSSVSRMRFERTANQISTQLRQVLRTPVAFSEWALSGRGSESIPMLLPPNIAKLVQLLKKAQASRKNVLMQTILGESRSDARAAKALQYVEDFLSELRRDLKARYKPVIKGM